MNTMAATTTISFLVIIALKLASGDFLSKLGHQSHSYNDRPIIFVLDPSILSQKQSQLSLSTSLEDNALDPSTILNYLSQASPQSSKKRNRGLERKKSRHSDHIHDYYSHYHQSGRPLVYSDKKFKQAKYDNNDREDKYFKNKYYKHNVNDRQRLDEDYRDHRLRHDREDREHRHQNEREDREHRYRHYREDKYDRHHDRYGKLSGDKSDKYYRGDKNDDVHRTLQDKLREEKQYNQDQYKYRSEKPRDHYYSDYRSRYQKLKKSGSPIVKNLLRMANDLNCDAQEECKDECSTNGKKKDVCDDKCEVKFDCEKSKEEETKDDECDMSDYCGGAEEKLQSTHGERLVTEKVNCARCKK